MNQLYPIIRRKRRPLISVDETNRNDATDVAIKKERSEESALKSDRAAVADSESVVSQETQ